MNRNALDKLYWGFWCSTTILTGILAGFMVSHSIMLGSFFNWYIETGNLDLLHKTFTVFRASNHARVLYNSPLYLALISGAAWTVLSFLLKKDRIIALVAGLSTLWTGTLFFSTSLNEAENMVLAGLADPALTRYFHTINLPLHTTFAVIYAVSLFLLLLVALKARRPA